jgi:hypothetical protein
MIAVHRMSGMGRGFDIGASYRQDARWLASEGRSFVA